MTGVLRGRSGDGCRDFSLKCVPRLVELQTELGEWAEEIWNWWAASDVVAPDAKASMIRRFRRDCAKIHCRKSRRNAT
jgi:hypothetical protein